MNQPIVTYSMGFAISHDGNQVLLLEKSKPAFLAGQWIGVGGHIEEGETPFEAMVREAKEEADLNPLPWTQIGVVGAPETPGQPNNTAQIFMFAAKADLEQAKTMTEERVQIFNWNEIETLPLAKSTREIINLVRTFAQETPKLKKSGFKP